MIGESTEEQVWKQTPSPRGRSTRALPLMYRTILPVLLGALLVAPLGVSPTLATSRGALSTGGARLWITSIDTMKESRDTETRPLTDAQIADDVNLAASLNTNYITVDTHWDYPAYMQHWVNAIRAAGRHVWFRIHPNQWGDNNGTTGIMTPAQYEESEQAFILAHPTLFRAGDILDPCPEPENGLYWDATYSHGWTSNAPNAATDDYNTFITTTSMIAQNALQQLGVTGVITRVRSTNSFFAAHPNALYPATLAQLGAVTVDSYPEGTTTDPTTAANARVDELDNIESVRHIPIIIGEMGFSNKVAVDDATQDSVLRAEFSGLSQLSYLIGVNYWVGAGTDNSGGYTHIFTGSTGAWTTRPAALDLAQFYGQTLQPARVSALTRTRTFIGPAH